MNEQQYYKWKSDTFAALVSSGVYSEVEADVVVGSLIVSEVRQNAISSEMNSLTP